MAILYVVLFFVIILVIAIVMAYIYKKRESYKLLRDIGDNEIEDPSFTHLKSRYPRTKIETKQNTSSYGKTTYY